MPYRGLVLSIFGFLALILSCGKKLDAIQIPDGFNTEGGDDCSIPEKVTYTRDIQPIMNTYCIRCHGATVTERLGAPVRANFDSYGGVLQFDEVNLPRMRSGNMPPGNVPKVSFCETEIYDAWLKGGKAE